MADEIRGLTEEALARVVAAAVQAANKLNPLEEKKLQEELANQKRRDLATLELAKIEQQSMENKKRACSHSRHEKTGLSVHKNASGAQWCTSGQANSTELVTLICQRCSYVWQWKPTAEEYAAIEQNGLMGWAPPDSSRIIYESVAGR